MKKALVRYCLLLLLTFVCTKVSAEVYPAKCRVTTTLNVRQGPGTGYYKMGTLYRNDYVVVESVTWSNSMQWGVITYYNRKGYVSMNYVTYLTPVSQDDMLLAQNIAGMGIVGESTTSLTLRIRVCI